MGNFDFGLVKHIIKIRKEQKKKKDKKYVVKFNHSASMEVDGKEIEVRTRDITVFEGNLSQCEAYIKLQMVDWMTSLLDVDIYSRSIEIRKTWQHLDKAVLIMHDFVKEDEDDEVGDFYCSYSYYTIYDENYYESYYEN